MAVICRIPRIRLEWERRKRLLTIEALSGRTRDPRVGVDSISAFEREEKVPNEDQLDELAYALGITPAHVLLQKVTATFEPEEVVYGGEPQAQVESQP